MCRRESRLYVSLKNLLIYPDIFFKDLFSRPIRLGIPFGIIGLLCLLNFPRGLFSFIYIIGHHNLVFEYLKLFSFILLFFIPFFIIIFLPLFFMIPLHFYAKIPFVRFKQTYAWVAYGMIPELGSAIIFAIIDLITKSHQIGAGFSVWDHHISILSITKFLDSDLSYTYSIIFVLLYLDLILGILFLFWSARLWYAGLSAAETLNKKQKIYIIFFIICIIIGIHLFIFHIGESLIRLYSFFNPF